MFETSATTILLNAGLLLALAVVFDLAMGKRERSAFLLRPLVAGVGVAAIGASLMLVPSRLAPGIQFDTRSVLLAISGLFFGPVPTLLAAAALAAFRVGLGGAGVPMGLAAIACSAALGLGWRRLRRAPLAELTAVELYGLGLVTHAVMVGLMNLLPHEEARRAMRTAAPMVLLVYPAATLVLGLLLRERLRAMRTATELARSEVQFRLLAEHAEDLIYRYEFTPTPRFVYVSPSATRMTGYTPEDHYANPLLGMEIVHPDDRPKLEAASRGEVAPGEPLVLRWIRSDGTVIWSEQRNQLIHDAEGRLVALEGVARDVTERMVAYERLRAAEQNYRHLFEASPQAMWVVDAETEAFLAVNDATVLRYGYAREELLTMKASDLEGPSAEDRRAPGGTSEDGLRQHVTRSGERRHVEIRVHPLSFEGRAARLVLVTDVTEQQRASRERERLIAAIEHAGESILITDLDGKIEYVNPAFERTSGFARAEVIGQTPRVLKSGRHDPDFYRQLWATITAGKAWRGRLSNKRRDGTPFVEEATISPVLDASGQLISFVAVKRDITEDLRLQEEYHQAQKMETVGRLAGGVAHDFNNLLTVINGTTALALESAPEGSPVRSDLQEILAAGERAAVLTKQLLAFSRKQVVAPEVLDLVQVVERVRSMLQRLIGEDIDLDVSSRCERALVRADAGQLEQVLVNLAVNARDAMERGGTLWIETSIVDVGPERAAATLPPIAPGRRVCLTVRDDGSGIDPETQGKIFEPFFTTKHPGKGTGLGLSTVLGIVKQAHGGVHVDSVPGRGTSFSIYLPVLAAPNGVEELIAPKIAARPGLGHEGILVVDDEDAVRAIVTRVLNDAGYRVHEATGGREALRILADDEREFDLLLTDVVMPSMNGRELSEAARRLRPGLKVLYTSGYTGDVALLEWVHRSGGPFLAKPYGPKGLLSKVRELLDAPALPFSELN